MPTTIEILVLNFQFLVFCAVSIAAIISSLIMARESGINGDNDDLAFAILVLLFGILSLISILYYPYRLLNNV